MLILPVPVKSLISRSYVILSTWDCEISGIRGISPVLTIISEVPEDPLTIMLGGVMEEMFPECWPKCFAVIMLIFGVLHAECPFLYWFWWLDWSGDQGALKKFVNAGVFLRHLPTYLVGSTLKSEMKCPDDPHIIMLGGVMDEMFPECWPECVAGVMLISEM
jgi:hypothetical protein